MVAGGLLMGVVVQAQAWLGYFNARRYLAVENVALYTSFTAAAWAVVAAVLYLSPRLI
jgi:heme/copper-type cytochrome/quinol oxidase subunit 3